MTIEDLFQFLRPETLKTVLRDVAENQDDLGWTVARDAIMDHVADTFMTDDEKLRFARFDPGP